MISNLRTGAFARTGRAMLMAGAALALTMTGANAETLRWARVADALTLDPHSQNEGPTSTLLHHIYETLVGRATDGSLQPRLATEWMISAEDPTVWGAGTNDTDTMCLECRRQIERGLPAKLDNCSRAALLMIHF